VLHRKFPGFDPGEVQDVVEDAQEMSAGLLDLADVVPLPGVQARLGGEVG